MAEGGAWADALGPILGVGEGRGVGLLLVLAGLIPLVATVAAYLSPGVRLIEDQLPDAIPDEQEEPEAGGAQEVAEASAAPVAK